MGKTILFTPLGGTDPISQHNCHDGSMLHICRAYRVDKAYLYLSAEILENHKKDNRYCYCLDKLGKQQEREIEYEIIERPDLESVHDFNYFYEDFMDILFTLCKGCDETDTVLLNISSGTPAMKSALTVLTTLGEVPCRLIQVTTPEKKMNTHVHGEYDVELAWELNEDNKEDFINRCTEVRVPSLEQLKYEQIIKKHVQDYDYRAAVAVAEGLSEGITAEYLPYLKYAKARLMQDYAEVSRLSNQYGIDCIPVKGSNERKFVEYALNLDVKLKHEEYADFIRALTPLLVDLFIMVLEKQSNLKLDAYTTKRQNNILAWDSSKLEGSEILSILNGQFFGSFRTNSIVASANLLPLIEHYVTDLQVKQTAGELRVIEEKIRNLAAHQIIGIKKESVEELTGFTAKQVMDKVKRMFTYTRIKCTAETWKSYDKMNELILAKIQNRI